ncbi:PH domain-containing protein [Streptomyces sp. NPDC005438]|uniref:PH domain-containing protein n=1 Tax=Streptomyces sp. NPDC005438 TaxID=3156880 RepID=UPI0033AD1EEB
MATQPLPSLPYTFRPTRTRVVLLTLGVLLAVSISGVGLVSDFEPSQRVAFVCTGLLALGVLCLLSRPRVTVDREGLWVVNLTTRRRLEWAEVLRVNLRSGDPWVSLDLSDGTTLAAMGIQTGIARERAIADARTLRALCEAYGAGDDRG